MARPKKPPEEKMDESIRIPVTVDQKRQIVEAGDGATTAGYTAWARDVLLKAAQAQATPKTARRKRSTEN